MQEDHQVAHREEGGAATFLRPERMTGPGQAVSVIRDTETAAATASAVAEIRAAAVMAMQRPRSLPEVKCEILDLLEDKSFCAVARYAKPVGGGKVRGWTIRFAEAALVAMRNVRVKTITTFENETQRNILVTVMDVERNTSFSEEATIAKEVERKNAKGREELGVRQNSYGETVYIVRATEDEMINKTNAIKSKVMRNAGLRLIPGHILDAALERYETTKEAKTDPAELKKQTGKVFDAFFKKGVKPAQIEAYLGHPVEQTNDAELADLREMYIAMRDDQVTWQSFVESKEDGDEAKAKKTGTQKKLTPSQTTASTDTSAGASTDTPKRKTKRQLLFDQALALGADIKELDKMKAAEIEAECVRLAKVKDSSEAPDDASEPPDDVQDDGEEEAKSQSLL